MVGLPEPSGDEYPLHTTPPRKALPELDISGIMRVCWENAWQRSRDQTGIDGLPQEVIEKQSRSRPAGAVETKVTDEQLAKAQ